MEALRYPNTRNRHSASETSCFPAASSSQQQYHTTASAFQTTNGRFGDFYERQQPVNYQHQQQADRLGYSGYLGYSHEPHAVEEARLRQAKAKLEAAHYSGYSHEPHAVEEARLRQAKAKLEAAQERLRQTIMVPLRLSNSYHLRPAMGDSDFEVPKVQDNATWRINPPKPPNARTAVRMSDAGLSRDASEVDELVFGRDLDGSANVVRDVRQGASFGGAAGSTSKEIWGGRPAGQSKERTAVRMSDAGMSRDASEVDEVVFGRDLDGSANVIKDVRQGASFGGAAGSTSREYHDREIWETRLPPPPPSHHASPFRTAMSRDCDVTSPVGSSPSPQKYFFAPPNASPQHFWGGGTYDPSFDPQRSLRGASRELQPAGGKRSLRDAGLNSQLSVVDELVFGRDMDASGGTVQNVRTSSQFAGACGRASSEAPDGTNMMGHITRTGGHYQSNMTAALSWPEAAEDFARCAAQPATFARQMEAPVGGYPGQSTEQLGQFRWDLMGGAAEAM